MHRTLLLGSSPNPSLTSLLQSNAFEPRILSQGQLHKRADIVHIMLRMDEPKAEALDADGDENNSRALMQNSQKKDIK